MDSIAYASLRRHIDIPAGRIAYAEKGEGPVALFVHGVIVNGYLWRHQLEELSDIRRCIAVDLMGHGHTTITSSQDVSFEAQADMLLQFLDALEIDTVDLVANDSGVGIAQIFAVRHPGRLRTLTLANGDVHDNWPPAGFAGFLDMVRAGGLPERIAAMARDHDVYRGPDGFEGAYENPAAVSGDTVDAYIQPLLANQRSVADLERFILAFDPAQTVAIESQLKGLRTPTLVVWGTGDIFFPVSWSRWLADTIPGTRRRVEYDGATLLLPEERPRALSSELRAHWATI
ncbi:alpha/beta hydrolase [Streptomyces malaysiensis subsp. malaysiensis]|uniref:Alpha/beta hydrolase n=1 Tax=Streptomyces malaysiensis TaxID=92644 RepID=A0ABX6WIP2_STRMQ|nr:MULTISPECIES: alpha/beta hydrolase [Streptomyces]QPI61317.1 alpha/beta hydrolase [Streptomyces solisilvae]UHH23087.1 alpha/beta hydrolase [Streptomyces sp. HNM0561]